MTGAACLGLEHADWFHPDAEQTKFPDDRQSRAVRDAWARALPVCAGCPARAACLDAELTIMRQGFITAGIVGGTTPGERRAMLTHGELSRRPPHELDPCGTTGGYSRHLREGTTACAECKRANARSKADRKAATAARKAEAETPGRLVLFPPVDWTVMRPARAAALAESWRLRRVALEASA